MGKVREVYVLLSSKNKADIQKAKDILASVSSSEMKQLITQRASEIPSIITYSTNTVPIFSSYHGSL